MCIPFLVSLKLHWTYGLYLLSYLICLYVITKSRWTYFNTRIVVSYGSAPYLADFLLFYSLPCSQFSGIPSLSLSGPLDKSASWEKVYPGSCTGLSGPSSDSPEKHSRPRSESFSVCVFLAGCSSLRVWFVSEPGYYEDGAFGIRIENVVLVVPVKTKVSNDVFIFF